VAGLIHLPESFTRVIQHHPQFIERISLMLLRSLKFLPGLLAIGIGNFFISCSPIPSDQRRSDVRTKTM